MTRMIQGWMSGEKERRKSVGGQIPGQGQEAVPVVAPDQDPGIENFVWLVLYVYSFKKIDIVFS